MNIKEYIRSQLTIKKQPDLRFIYEELLNAGHSAEEIYYAINEVIKENIDKIIKDYLEK